MWVGQVVCGCDVMCCDEHVVTVALRPGMVCCLALVLRCCAVSLSQCLGKRVNQHNGAATVSLVGCSGTSCGYGR